MFLVPSFCMVGNAFFVPGPFLVGFGGMKVGMSMMHLTLFSNLTVPSPYIHAPNRIAGFHVKLVPRIFVWIPLPHAQSWSRHCECCLVCLAVLRRHWTQQVQKRTLLFCKKPCLASMDPLSVCVYACTRGSCVDSIWLWVRKETFSKPVFGVSKTSISGFVAVGPHCNMIYLCSKTGFFNKRLSKQIYSKFLCPSFFFTNFFPNDKKNTGHDPSNPHGWRLTRLEGRFLVPAVFFLTLSEKRDPGCLGHVEDYTTQLCWDYNAPWNKDPYWKNLGHISILLRIKKLRLSNCWAFFPNGTL